MGAAATKKEDKEAKARTIRTKVKALAAFNPVPGKKNTDRPQSSSSTKGGSKRDELLQFIRTRREEKLETWDNLQKGYDAEDAAGGMRAASMVEIPDDDLDETMNAACGICSETDIWEMMPCRVCGRKYHRKCLTGSGLYSDHEIGFFDRAETAIGWSCLKCDNIFNLLTTNELDELSNDFERLDLNKDASISLDEYLQHRRRLHLAEYEEEMTEREEQFERIQFKYLDADGSGTMEYSEYLKHHACLRLATRPKEELVALLTSRERRYALQVFSALDSEQAGHVTVVEAQLAYRSWYTGLFNNMVDEGKVSRNALNGLSDLKASLVVDIGDTSTRAMDWEEFLANRAIYLISSRPNNVAALCGEKKQ